MPHQHTDSPDGPAQNSVGERQAPNDAAREDHRSVRPEPRSYAAPEAADASLAPPAAGEFSDYFDEGDPLADEGAQQGGDRTLREAHAHRPGQGPKTVRANREILRTGRAE